MSSGAKERLIAVRVDSEIEKYIDLAVRHDYLLYKGNGMNKGNLSEWIRFLINIRINQIVESKKGG